MDPLKDGVLYWNSGTKLLVRLTVSLASLRESGYQHRIVVALANCPPEYGALLRANGVEILPLEYVPGHKEALLMKTRLNQVSPFRYTVYLDCDTLVLRPFDEMWDWTERYGFVVTRFADMNLVRGSIARRVEAWHRLGITDADWWQEVRRYPAGINIGVLGFHREASIFRDWHNLAVRGMNAYIPDEVSCQYLLVRHPHHLAPGYFNQSCNRGRIDENTRVVHYHGRKHLSLEKTEKTGAAALWIETARRYYAENRFGLRDVAAKWNYRSERSVLCG